MKNYAIIQNAYAKSMRDGVPFWGPYISLGSYDARVIDTYYAENLSNMKEYFKIKNGPVYSGNKSGGGLVVIGDIYLGKREIFKTVNNLFKFLNGNSLENFMVNSDSFAFSLEDGTIIAIFSGSPYYRRIFIDVNGPAKPNTFGRDIYLLQAIPDSFLKTYKIYPYGSPYTGNYYKIADGKIEEVPSTCKMNSTGETCAYEIVKNKAYKIPKN